MGRVCGSSLPSSCGGLRTVVTGFLLVWCLLGKALYWNFSHVGKDTMVREVLGGFGKRLLYAWCGVFGGKEMLIVMKEKSRTA